MNGYSKKIIKEVGAIEHIFLTEVENGRGKTYFLNIPGKNTFDIFIDNSLVCKVAHTHGMFARYRAYLT